MFSAVVLLSCSLTILAKQVNELIACVRRANENARNLIFAGEFIKIKNISDFPNLPSIAIHYNC